MTDFDKHSSLVTPLEYRQIDAKPR